MVKCSPFSETWVYILNYYYMVHFVTIWLIPKSTLTIFRAVALYSRFLNGLSYSPFLLCGPIFSIIYGQIFSIFKDVVPYAPFFKTWSYFLHFYYYMVLCSWSLNSIFAIFWNVTLYSLFLFFSLFLSRDLIFSIFTMWSHIFNTLWSNILNFQRQDLHSKFSETWSHMLHILRRAPYINLPETYRRWTLYSQFSDMIFF